MKEYRLIEDAITSHASIVKEHLLKFISELSDLIITRDDIKQIELNNLKRELNDINKLYVDFYIRLILIMNELKYKPMK